MAAGAIAFVSGKAQAIVIGDEVYTPLNITATYSYVVDGKVKQATLTSKDILKYEEGTTPNLQLALAEGGNEVWVINTKTKETVAELSEEFVITRSELIEEGSEGGFHTKGADFGTISIAFYSNGDQGGEDPVIDNEYAFICTGLYGHGQIESALNTKDDFTLTEKYKALVGGTGYNQTVEEDTLLPVSVSVSSGGSGLLED
jgi:hypothetical protein